MGFLGLFKDNWQDDSKRPLVNKWLETLEPPDLESLSELEHDFDSDHEHISDHQPTTVTPAAESSSGMSEHVSRHYDLSQVQFSTWQDPYRVYATPQYQNSWTSSRSAGNDIVYTYQVPDEETSSEEEDEGEDDVGEWCSLLLSLVSPRRRPRSASGCG